MCGRFSQIASPQDIAKRVGPLGVQTTEQAAVPAYNIAPTDDVLAIVAPKGKPEARIVRWGLVPPSAEKIEGPPRYNAKTETLLNGTYYGVAADPPHRALIVATEFLEWVKAEHKRKVKPAPFGFTVDGGKAFCLAGLCAVNSRGSGRADRERHDPDLSAERAPSPDPQPHARDPRRPPTRGRPGRTPMCPQRTRLRSAHPWRASG